MDRPSLNHSYRLVWSYEQDGWVAVPETAKGRGKSSLRLLVSALLLAPVLALSGPTGGNVTSGSAAINQSGTVTSINQSSQRAAINWQGFSVKANETVNFNQPNASAVTLNRVIGNERSVIDGALNANGQVFLVNSNGVLFTKGSSVNVGGLVASTRNISDANFNAGKNVFEGSGTGSVVNQGTITAKDGGYVALLGNSVSNQGVISATKGTVAMAAGDKVTLNFNGDSLISVTLDEGTLNALVENKQAIYADGGTVLLTAKAADELLSSLVNNSGIIRARSIGDLTGKIELNALGGTTQVDGTLDASAPTTGNGGFIETSGDHVKVADSANILTRSERGSNGTWLVDPVDFTIAATGGDMTGAFLGNYLNTQGNYEVKSVAGAKDGNGDINVNDVVTWGSANTLTLTAVRDVNINNAININGAAGKLVLTTGRDYNIRTPASYSGTVLDANGKPVPKQDTSGGVYGSVNFNNTANRNGLVINGKTYTLIHSMAQWDALDGVGSDTTFDTVSGNYAIARNLEAGGTSYSIAPVYFFAGTLTGLGHTVNKFTVDNTEFSAGFIGDGASNGPVTVRDLGMTNIGFTRLAEGSNYYGAILGDSTAILKNVYSTGTISGGLAGGLAGRATMISSSFSSVNLTGFGGGLVESISAGPTTPGGIVNSHSTGNVTLTLATSGSGGSAGGLARGVGCAMCVVTNSYATGNVSVIPAPTLNPGPRADRASPVGGLIGGFGGVLLADSFATGNVTGGSLVGGLIGSVSGPGTNGTLVARNLYATGNVNAIYNASGLLNLYIGGLFGAVNQNVPPSGVSRVVISDVFATGNVAVPLGGQAIGGLIGTLGYSTTAGLPATTNSITNSYATGNVNVGLVPGETSNGTGGLIGQVFSSTLTNVHADGNVTGDRLVGGLTGNATNSLIQNSYATGSATALGNTLGVPNAAGGLTGGLNNSATSNVFYDSTRNSSGIGVNFNNSPGQTVTGLSSSQIGDIKFYVDRSIGQVLADRSAAAATAAAAAAAEAARVAAAEAARAAAAEAARAAAAQETARVTAAAAASRQAATGAAGTIVAQTFKPTDPAQSTAQVTATTSPGRSLDQNIVVAKPRSFSANVRQIEVDGQVYQIEEEGGEKTQERK